MSRIKIADIPEASKMDKKTMRAVVGGIIGTSPVRPAEMVGVMPFVPLSPVEALGIVTTGPVKPADPRGVIPYEPL